MEMFGFLAAQGKMRIVDPDVRLQTPDSRFGTPRNSTLETYTSGRKEGRRPGKRET